MNASPAAGPEGSEGSASEPMRAGLTMADTARAAAGLRWTVERLAGLIGSWAAGTEDAKAAVWLATAARHLEQHLDGLEELRPGYEALAEAARPGPARPEVDAALEGVAAVAASPAERLGVANRVLLEGLSAHCTALRAAAAHADAPLDRAMEFLMVDLRRDLEVGEALLEGLDAGKAAAAAETEAQGRLDAAGGLF